jgi:hypothetical protein
MPGQENTMLARAHQSVVNVLSQPFSFGAPPAVLERVKQYVRDHARSRDVVPPEWTH